MQDGTHQDPSVAIETVTLVREGLGGLPEHVRSYQYVDRLQASQQVIDQIMSREVKWLSEGIALSNWHEDVFLAQQAIAMSMKTVD
jgi:hypothetical protein